MSALRVLTPRLRALSAFACAATLAVAGASAGRRALANDRAEAEPLARSTDEARVELGRRLFFDPLVSRTGQRACAACHDPAHGFSDPAVRSDDEVGLTERHSQTLVDVHLRTQLHWDGQFRTVADVVDARIGKVSDMMCGGRSALSPPGPSLPRPGERAHRGLLARTAAPVGHGAPFGSRPTDLNLLTPAGEALAAAGRYRQAFHAAFGEERATTARIADAIEAYCLTLRSTPAPVDRFLAGDEQALSAAARRGLELFRGRAQCASCHSMKGARPTFTDDDFHVTGITQRSLDGLFRPQLPGTVDADLVLDADLGREAVTTAHSDRRKYRTPTLRDVARRGPFMHDGSLATLEDVVRHYAAGGSRDPRQDEALRPFDVDDGDVADLVAFLHALTGDRQPGIAPRAWHLRAERTRLTFVDGRGRAMAGLAVVLQPEGDLLPEARGAETGLRTLVTDAEGRIEFRPSDRTHVRLVLPEGLVPTGGPLVPDTCAQAEVLVPVDGRVRIFATFTPDEHVADVLVAEHDNPYQLPGNLAPRTTLRRASSVSLDGREGVAFEGWYRTDVSSRVTLRLPGDTASARHALELAPGATLRLER